jgi:hypothetical protein
MKRFVLLQFLNLRAGRTTWTGDQAYVRPLPTQENTHTEELQANNYALSGIRTHDPSV